MRRRDGRGGPALADHPAQPHRLTRRPNKTDTAEGARQPARRRGDRAHQGAARPAERDVLLPARRARLVPRRRPAPAAAPRGVGRARSPTGRATAPTSTRALEGRGLAGMGRQAAHVRRRREGRDPRGAVGTCLNATLDVVPGLIARRRRPHRATPAPSSKDAKRQSGRGAGRPPDALRHPRARHGRRSWTAWRCHGGVRARRRHVLRVLRLHASVGAPGRARRGQVHLRRGPTTRSASARTARRTSRSSSSPSLRAMPRLRVIRPADANETAEAWRIAVDARRARPR